MSCLAKLLPIFVLAKCGSDAFATGTDAGGADSTPTSCDLTKDPRDSPACIDDSVGVFGSVKGADTNPGTKAAPLATINAALKKSPSRIYVCEGGYSSTTTISAPVGIYGGFDCASWSYSAARPKVTGSFAIVGATGVSLVDLEVASPDAAPGSGASSVAVRVSSSQKVSLRRMKLVAGNGGSGADGTLNAPTFTPVPSGLTATGPAPGGAVMVTCPSGETSVGGEGGAYMVDGSPGTPGKPNAGKYTGCVGGGKGGGPGAVGETHAPALGAQRLGVLTADGWTSEAGTNGLPGSPGQGGGGGSTTDMSVGGSGGGAGGCGGAGGGGGKGGGGSFGLAVIDSAVTLRASAIETKTGGAGGQGVGGQGGQSMGGKGGHLMIPASCDGGSGGGGGNGAAGGGGAGGVSIGVFYKGTAPDVDADTQSNIKAGNAGPSGKGAGASNDGIDGISSTKPLACMTPSCG